MSNSARLVVFVAVLTSGALSTAGCDSEEPLTPLIGRFEASVSGDRFGTFTGVANATRVDYTSQGASPATTQYRVTLLSEDEQFNAWFNVRTITSEGLRAMDYPVIGSSGTFEPGEALGTIAVSDSGLEGRAYITTGTLTVTDVKGDKAQIEFRLDGAFAIDGEELAIEVEGRFGTAFVVP